MPVPPADVAAFSAEQRLTTIPSWHFLTGSYPSLQKVWQAYNVEVEAPSPNADIIHSSVMYFIGPSGQERYVASPMDDHTKAGLSFLPADQRAAALLVRFFRSGAGPMLKMMGGKPARQDPEAHCQPDPPSTPGLANPRLRFGLRSGSSGS